MSDAATYTLGMFDSSALGWTVPTPKEAAAYPIEADPDEEPVAEQQRPTTEGREFRLTGDRQLTRGDRVPPRGVGAALLSSVGCFVRLPGLAS